MSYTLTRSGLSLKITDTDTGSIQYFQQPNVTLNPAQVGGNPIDSVTFKTNSQNVSLVVKNITSINGVAPAGTLDGIMDQIMALLATTGAAPALSGSGHIIAMTDSTDGAIYTSFPNTSCTQLVIVNTTGQDLDVFQVGSTTRITILNGLNFMFRGIYNANQLSVRRTDRSNVQVIVQARWEA